MKRFVTLMAALMLLVSLSVAAMAAPANFIASPESLETPGINNDYIITPYGQRSTLPDGGALIEESYSKLTAAKLSSLSGSDEKQLVTSLFDIRPKDANSKGPYSIVLTLSDPDNFLALIHYSGGAWTKVNATLNGKNLSFTADSLSPYAIISKTTSSSGTPISQPTGEPLHIGYIAGAVVLAAGAVWFFVQSRKVKA